MFFGKLKRFPDRFRRLSRPSEQEDPGAGYPVAAHHLGGMVHFTAREPFRSPSQHRIGSALEGNAHAHEACPFHRRQQRIVKVKWIQFQALEPGAVSDPRQRGADLHGMLQRRIEDAVHELDIPQPGSREPRHGIGDAAGILQAEVLPSIFG